MLQCSFRNAAWKIGISVVYLASLLSAWHPLIPRNAVMAAFFLLCVLAALRDSRAKFAFAWSVQGAGIVFIAVLSIVSLWSPTPAKSLHTVLADMAIYTIGLWLAVPAFLRSDRTIKTCTFLLVISILVGSITVIIKGFMGIFQTYLPTEPGHQFFGYIASMTLGFSLVRAVQAGKRKERWLWAVTGTLIGWALIWNGMRGAWLGVVLQVIFLVIMCSNRKKMIIVLALFAAVASTIVVFTPLIYERAASVRLAIDMLRDETVYQYYVLNPANIEGEAGPALAIRERFYYMEAAVEMGKAHPLTGVGMGNYRSALKQYWNKPHWEEGASHPHNSFLNMFASCGWPGLLAMIGLTVCHFFYFWRRRNNGSWGGQCGVLLVVGFCVASMSDTLITNRMTMVMYGLIMSLALADIKLQEEKEEP